jgi:hypothetical protein
MIYCVQNFLNEPLLYSTFLNKYTFSSRTEVRQLMHYNGLKNGFGIFVHPVL